MITILPNILFKIVSKEQFEKSKELKNLLLSPDDSEFIHFSEKHQIERIIGKFFSNVKDILILEIDPNLLEGRLVKEKNPGGETLYYHLYEGCIPLKSIKNKTKRLANLK
jgi:uncharacterized protein (DUF952 family)